jgi:hypothetical protein
MLGFIEFLLENINMIGSVKSPKVKGRIRIIKARIRTVDGKPTVQRRKRVSNIRGYVLKGTSTLRRISPQEKLHRKMGQRRAKVKRRAKMARIVLKRARSMRRRESMGLK